MRATETANKKANEPRKLIGCDFLLSVFCGSTVALGEALDAPILGCRKRSGLSLGGECLGRNDITLPAAERPSAFSVANEHGCCGLGWPTALLPVLADSLSFFIGLD